MSTASLSLAQSPPLAVPMRLFVTGPGFGVLAGVLVAWTGTAGMSDRWMPAALAATHLLTLGYMGMIMLGALMQVFPVVIGHPFRHAGRVSIVVQVLLGLGVLLLAAGFLVPSGGSMAAALAMLAAAFGTFLAAAASSIARINVWGDTARAIALALAAFTVMTALGLWLALGHTPYLALPRAWTDIHAGWGLAGWVPLLLMGVAWQVVPMFQVTPEYPRTVRRVFPVLLFAMLLAATAAQGFGFPEWLIRLPQGIAGIVLAGFAAATLILQRRRRRRRADVTVAYWRVGLGCLILAVLVWTAGLWLPAVRSDARFALLLGVLMIPGFSLSVINGMLYKIVPFLVWLHLAMPPAASGRPPATSTPGVKQIIPERQSWLQLKLHATACALIAAGVLGLPGLLPAGALVFALACAWLGHDIVTALRLYRRHAAAPLQAPPPRSAHTRGPASE